MEQIAVISWNSLDAIKQQSDYHCSGWLTLFAGDQKIDHLNNYFYGEGIHEDDNEPEHLFKIVDIQEIWPHRVKPVASMLQQLRMPGYLVQQKIFI